MKTRKNLNVWLAMSMFLLAMGCGVAAGQIIYVDVDSPGINDGSSWTDAYNYLQDALADANSAAKPVEIRVAQGVYLPDCNSAEPDGTGDREATFQLKNGVAIRGGYAGFGEPDPNARDVHAYETILSGDLDGNDIDVNDPEDLQDEPSRSENSYHVATASGTDETAILDGFTITGGYANGEGWPVCLNRGGGIYSDSGSPTLMNCTISGNSASVGGGIENHGSGMYHHLNCNPTLTNCAISGNNGGGIRSSGSPMLINCTISGNNGCGMINGLGSPTLTNCTISGNNGGGWNSCDSYSTLINCVFVGNSSDWDGGAWFSVDSDSVLVNCVFVGNSTSGDGGGIYSTSDYSMTLTNSILWGNSDSGGMDASAQIDGGGSINYCCIQGGLVGTGNIDADPLFVDSGRWVDANDPNVIVEPNDPNAVWVDGNYHLKSEGWRWDANRKVWTWDDVTSPCIDAGNPGCALGDELLSVPDDPNNEWGENLRINMGAFGGTAEASMGLPGWALLADLTNDGIVDFVDLAAFVNYWLETGECIPSDLNRSQAVDFVDFAIFARQRRENNYILLEIYSDGWGNLLETATMKEEGQITILVYEEEPYSYPPAMYYVYASRDGYYTEIYYCEASGSPPNNFITVDVDLDPIVSGKFNGVIFMTQSFFSDRYLPNTDVTVKEGETVVTEFQTDEQGRFAIEIEPGNYDFEFISGWQEYRLEPVSIGGEYQDFFFPADIMVVLKPNIYLYPEETIELDVDIVFPHGGRITTSIPDYNDGWHITVEPSGTIDGQYQFLFYESVQPDYGQYLAGWVVAREELETFFQNNMGQTGFNQREIDDFIEYWIPILTEYPYYAIYPQYRGELEEMIKLEFSAQPESLIRLIYSVRGLEDNNLNIQEPVIPPFTRDGFTVTEWGVILK